MTIPVDNHAAVRDARPRPTDALHMGLAVCFGLFLFSASFSIAFSQIALGLSLLLFLTIVAREPYRPCPARLRAVYFAMAAYILWLVVSSLTGGSPASSIGALREEWLFLIVPVAFYLFREKRHANRLILALAAGLLLAALYGIVQYFTGVHWFRSAELHTVGSSYRLSGNFSHPLTYGYYVAIASVFFLSCVISAFRKYAGRRLLLLCSVTLTGLAAVALCNSRGPMLALAVGLLAVGLLHRKFNYVVPVLALLIIAGALLSPGLRKEFTQRLESDLTTENSAGRLYIWSNALDIIADRPVTGVGPGNFGSAYTERLPVEAPDKDRHGHAHNDFLNVAAVAGLPGLGFYLGVWGVILARLWRKSRERQKENGGSSLPLAVLAASITFLVASLTEAAFADEELRQLLMALWGMGLASGSANQE